MSTSTRDPAAFVGLVRITGRPAVRRACRRVAWPAASVALVLAALQAAVSTHILSENSFPTVPQLLAAFVELLGRGDFWGAVLETVRGTAVGFGIAALIGVPAGVLLGTSDVLFHASRFVVEFLRPIPVVAIIPLVVLLYGTGFTSKLVLVIFAALFPILLQTIYGVRDTDPVALETARSYRLGRLRELTMVMLPNALPFVATGMRISAAIALLVAISAELIIGAPGIGQEIINAQAGSAVALMYGLILATGLLGVLLNAVLTVLERRLVPWGAASQRKETP
ncbi:MAG: ABC transporter permease subunit [Streptosporangiales bacterium]|nr:ABC transporter permease subunit [Streptosporangiales bacterium]